ncbi:MAG: hypothetical protein KY476_17835 [Planctomycetes bacterium]|nr:hypothetical protein [Planctomycetota bacterium]
MLETLAGVMLSASLAAGPVVQANVERPHVHQPPTVHEFVSGPVTFGGTLYPFDSSEPWVHGYHQEMPAYGGYAVFRPYNYKHVFAQAQAAGGWGMSPTMPYSQQFWHRYSDEAESKVYATQLLRPVIEPAGLRLPAGASYRAAATRRAAPAPTPRAPEFDLPFVLQP